MTLHKDLENFKALISLTAKDMGILEFPDFKELKITLKIILEFIEKWEKIIDRSIKN